MKNLALLGILSVLALGCGDDDGRGSDRDSGGLTLMDSGMIVLPDTGTPPMMDAGGSTTWPAECRNPITSLVDIDSMDTANMWLPRCAAATTTCLSGCADNACVQRCLDADTTAPLSYMGQMLDCSFCYSYQLDSCISNNGCTAQLGEFYCCAEARGCTDIACVEAMCPAENAALNTCIMGVDLNSACPSYVSPCFGM